MRKEKENVCDTMYAWQANALQNLSRYGLTPVLLLSWKPPTENGRLSEFNNDHQRAFSQLIRAYKFSPQDAIQILHEKTGQQASFISTLLENNPSLSAKEVIAETIGLTPWMLASLKELYSHGLRRAHLLSWKPPIGNGTPSDFDYFHRIALSKLIQTYKFSPQDAIQVLHEKTGQRASAIVKLLKKNPSLSAKEAITETTGLTPWMLVSLKNLYSHGLRRAHLLSWKPPIENGTPSDFDKKHWIALWNLIVVNRFKPIEEAVTVINEVNHHVAVQAAEHAISTIRQDKPIATARQYMRVFGSVIRTRRGSLATLPFDIFNLIVQIATGFLHTRQFQSFFAKPCLTQSLFRSVLKKNTQNDEQPLKKARGTPGCCSPM